MKTLRPVAAAVLASTFLLPAQEGGKPAPSTGAPAEAAAKASPQAAQALLVGVVDLVKAFEQYPKYIKYKAQLDALAKQYKERVDNVSKSIDELKGAYQVLEPDSEERRQKQFEYEMAMQTREGMAKFLNEQLNLEVMRAEVAIYEDLETAITKVAKARGVALVLRMSEIEPRTAELGKLSARGVQGRHLAYERRQVWFASEQVDLTGDLIKLLMVPIDEPKQPAKAPEKAPAEKAPATPKGGG